ncbi:N-acetyltransferase [Cryptosporangium sp. NPDC048952]|uniref:N-acetyltransferase n=1 Tax=Cryptosporangium sp. NPDC048952 TaxID=3363961 RepID=UPI0037135644
MTDFVPDHFEPPRECVGEGFRLVPLDVEHNERDYEAWTSSMEHIAQTPGFANWGWPKPMTLAENHGDLARHAADFRNRVGFTYTVLDGDDVIGCVYIYPGGGPGEASVRSWVRESRAELDRPLYERVTQWLAEAWPFTQVVYAPREAPREPARPRGADPR